MQKFETTEQAEAVFGSLFKILSEDKAFTTALQENDMTVRLLHTKPDCRVFVSADAVELGEDIPDRSTITIKMTCDTADALWRGDLMMPSAVATGRVRIRGKVAKVIELIPILQPAFDRYPEIAAEHGIAGGK
jgi:putative sterol carrier protein